MIEDEAGQKSPEINDQSAEHQASRVAAEGSRLICHFLLLIALIFVVTALEDGSYRTPWPAAILVSLGAVGLCYKLLGKKTP